MTKPLTIGFLPLVDAALPILAHEHGFAEEEGLALSFVKDVSWATVLDRLRATLDAAAGGSGLSSSV